MARTSFNLTEEKLEKWGMSGRPAMRLVKFAKKGEKEACVLPILKFGGIVRKIWY